MPAVIAPPHTPRRALTDAQLCARVRRGDADAKAAIIERYEPLINSIIGTFYMAPGTDRDDMRQEARLGILRAAEIWRPRRKVKFVTYMTWAVRNRILKEVVRQQQQLRPGLEAAERIVQPAVDRIDLTWLLDQLPPLESAVLRLHFGIDGKTYRDRKRISLGTTAIGRRLGISRDEVLAALARGMELVRDLQPEED